MSTAHELDAAIEAVGMRDIGALQGLIDRQPLWEVCDDDGLTLLHYVARHEFPAGATLLLSRGARVCHRDKSGQSAAEVAIRAHSPGVLDVCLQFGAGSCPSDSIGRSLIHHCAEFGRLEAAQRVFAIGMDLQAVDVQGRNATLIAAYEGNEEVLWFLIDSGVSPLKPDVHGMLPIHWAAMQGHSGIVNGLISRGTPINALDPLQRTPLFYAVIGARRETIVALCHLGADVRVRDTHGAMARDYLTQITADTRICRLLDTQGRERGQP
jgi:uncharacterized protein